MVYLDHYSKLINNIVIYDSSQNIEINYQACTQF